MRAFFENLKRHWRPLVTMLFLPAMLAELVSEATPAAGFFSPVTLVLFALLGYGLPVTVIREFAVRRGIGLAGIFVLGLAYGIYNEGFIAKTLIKASGGPDQAYDNYSIFLGINTAWMGAICAYHAMCSVLAPIVIVHAMFPEESKAPWLGVRTAQILFGIFLVIGCLSLMGKENGQGTFPQLFVFLALWAAAVFVALRLKPVERPEWPKRMSVKPVFWGMSVLLLLGSLSAVAHNKWPVPVFAAVEISVLALYIRVLTKRYADMASLRLFIAGVYLESTAFGTLLRTAFQKDAVAAIVTGVAATAALVWWVRKILREGRARPAVQA